MLALDGRPLCVLLLLGLVRGGAAVLCSSRLCCFMLLDEELGSMADRRGRRLTLERRGDAVVEEVGDERLMAASAALEAEADEEAEMSDLRLSGGEADDTDELDDDSAESSALGGVVEAEMESRMRRRDMLRLSDPERAGRPVGLLLLLLVDDEDEEKEDERMMSRVRVGRDETVAICLFGERKVICKGGHRLNMGRRCGKRTQAGRAEAVDTMHDHCSLALC